MATAINIKFVFDDREFQLSVEKLTWSIVELGWRLLYVEATK